MAAALMMVPMMNAPVTASLNQPANGLQSGK
jgi:hypothetical protein